MWPEEGVEVAVLTRPSRWRGSGGAPGAGGGQAPPSGGAGRHVPGGTRQRRPPAGPQGGCVGKKGHDFVGVGTAVSLEETD